MTGQMTTARISKKLSLTSPYVVLLEGKIEKVGSKFKNTFHYMNLIDSYT